LRGCSRAGGYRGHMGRTTKPGAARSRATRRWEPSGVAWESLRAHLFAQWRAARTPCYHCGCPHDQAPPDQVEHLISPQKRPDLAMDENNLRPTHSRCPCCGLWCNNLSAGNAAPRDAQGRSLPFPREFKERKMAEAAAKPPRGVARRDTPPTPAVRAQPPRPGREW